MNCRQVRHRLDAYVDEGLSLPERHAVDEHLASCPRCRAEVDELRRLLEAAATLPRGIDPPERVWAGIERGLDEAEPLPAPARPVPGWRTVVLGVAAALTLMAGSSAVTWTIARRETAAGATAALPVLPPGPVRQVDADFVTAAAELERALEARRASLQPETVAVLERNLRLIADAIAEAREALATDPANSALADRLWGAHRARLDLLQRAVSL